MFYLCCGIWGDLAFGHLHLLHPVFGHLLDKIPLSGGFLPPSSGNPSSGNHLVRIPFMEFPLQALSSWGNDYFLELAAQGWELGRGSQLYLLVSRKVTQ